MPSLRHAALIAFLPALAFGRDAHVEKELGVPALEAVAGEVMLDGVGAVTFDLSLRYDHRGRLIAGGPCTVDGAAVEVKGKLKRDRKAGGRLFALLFRDLATGVVGKVTGELTDGAADVAVFYKGPRGKAFAEATLDVSATSPVSASLDASFAENPDERLTRERKGRLVVVYADLACDYGNLGEPPVTFLAASVKRSKLAFVAKRGKGKLSFKGVWVGDGWRGKLQWKFPPDKGKQKDFFIPPFVVPDGEPLPDDDPDPEPGVPFTVAVLSGDMTPGLPGGTFGFISGTGSDPSLHLTDDDVLVFRATPLRTAGPDPSFPNGALWAGPVGALDLVLSQQDALPVPGGGMQTADGFFVREFGGDGDALLDMTLPNLEKAVYAFDRSAGTVRHVFSTLEQLDPKGFGEFLFWDSLTTSLAPDGTAVFVADDDARLGINSLWVNAPGGPVGTTMPVFADGDLLSAGADTGEPGGVNGVVAVDSTGRAVFLVDSPLHGLYRTTGAGGAYEQICYEHTTGGIRDAQGVADPNYTWGRPGTSHVAGGDAQGNPILAFQASVDGPGRGPSSNEGLWIAHPAHTDDFPRPVVFEADTVGPGNDKLDGDFEPEFIAAGRVFATVTLDNDPNEFNEPIAVLSYDGTSLDVVAIEGRQGGADREFSMLYGFAPAAGLLLRTDDFGFTAPDNGGVLWLAQAPGRGDDWLPVVAHGDLFEVAPGEHRTVFDFWASNVNADGKFLLALAFTDSSYALVVVNVPALLAQ